MKRIALLILKIGVSVAILAYLAVQAQRNAVFSDLWARPKQWGLLALSTLIVFTAVAITFVRWFLLVRALGVPLRLRDAFRLGFLGYLFNLAPMGMAGGDLLKMLLLAREQPGHKAEAFTSVFVDRMLGLGVLFLVASTASVASGFYQTQFRWVCELTWIVTAVFTVGLVVPLLPGVSRGGPARLLGRLPYAGPFLRKVAEALGVYRTRRGTVLVAALLTAGVHLLFGFSVYLIADAFYDAIHGPGYHCVMVPLCAATAVVPVSMGPFELVLDTFYAGIPLASGESMKAGQGLVTALGYRIETVLVAAVGICYYLSARREVVEVIHEEEVAEAGGEPPPL